MVKQGCSTDQSLFLCLFVGKKLFQLCHSLLLCLLMRIRLGARLHYIVVINIAAIKWEANNYTQEPLSTR